MSGKIKLEWGDNNDIILSKKRGKISFREVIEFMHERDQMYQFDGDLMVFQFRVSDAHDIHDFADEMLGEPEGDIVVLQVVQDDTMCPVCGKKRLFPQYCPDCGRKLDD